MGDDEPCDIVRKGDVVVSLSNGLTLKLKNTRHISKLKRNLNSVRQLADRGEIQDHQRCHGVGPREEGTYSLHDVGFQRSILVTSSDLDGGVWHRRLGHMSEKGMKIMLSKDNLLELKSVELDFYEDCVYRK